MAGKEKVVFWADPERTFGNGLVFGDEVTGLIDAERLEAWLDDGTLSEEKPESVAHASQSKLAALAAKVEELELENTELKTSAKKAPKPSAAAKKKLEDAAAELEAANTKIANLTEAAKGNPEEKVTQLEETVLEKEIEIENLTAKVKELGGDK